MPLRKVRRFRKVLAIFPHPDDEAVTCGGTLRRLAADGASVTLVLLTGGERGNPTGTVDIAIEVIRRREAEKVAGILGIARLIHADFQDGGLSERHHQLAAYLSSAIEQTRPDLIITYDRAGLDGHPDHIVCSDVVTSVRRQRFPDVALWYVALPARLQRLLMRAGQLANDPELAEERARPTHGVFIGPATLAKMAAVRAHASQRQAIGKGLGRAVPSWLMVGMQQVEYFAEQA